ncbi:IucA/IucC family siderophore biosynthesis protein [Dactylosporangium aurantiacum]|uniref:IucA/IucC family siderophore biosynthesis protein n=1 Tax=Dactylosporangium aurantiacum TaxID=35754 RepID=A0A9Q9ITT7_9ACTN|nr:IucA/IucC family siderophore biosynthesis protein [Dactylosporangium aurantiacum]
MVAPDEQATLQALQASDPDLAKAYLRALPQARAGILRRLWGALWREGVVDTDRLGTPAPALFGPIPDAVVADGVAHTHPARLIEALRPGGNAERLVRELDNSVANLALGLAAATGVTGAADDLVGMEQSIVDGHPLHPCCRTRIGMSTADVLAYAPEHHPQVRLRIVEVDPGRWRTTGAPRPPLLPVHPWQLHRALATGLVRDTGRDLPARPLMSLRTLAPVDDPSQHIKTAVEVQMTSAVRTLSAAAVHNGPLASDLVATLAARTRGLRVLRETTAATVLDTRGDPQRALGAVWRQAPPAGTFVVPLALLPHRPDLLTPACFAELVRLLLPALFDVLRDGVALEAHGQNTLVELRDGHPVRIWYRDLGGLHVHPGRLRRAGLQMPPLIGALPTDDEDELRTKLFAAALSTVLTELVHALGSRLGADVERAAWDVVAATIRDTVTDTDDRKASLADTWPLKATTAMRLADDPLQDLWCQIPNPLR